MPRAHTVAVRVLPGCQGRVRAPELRRAAQRLLALEGVSLEVGAEVVLADAATVRELNRVYRGRDEPADVLSYASMEGGGFVEAPGEPSSLGEVIVCLPVAEEQAAASGQPVAATVAHLLVHGLLHLLGYDHEEDAAEAARMQAREDEALAALGFAGQYEHGH